MNETKPVTEEERGIKNALFKRGDIYVTSGITSITHTQFLWHYLCNLLPSQLVQTIQKHPRFSHTSPDNIMQEMFLQWISAHSHWVIIKGLNCRLVMNFHFPSLVPAKKWQSKQSKHRLTKWTVTWGIIIFKHLPAYQILADQIAVPHPQAQSGKEKDYFLIVFSLIFLTYICYDDDYQ